MAANDPETPDEWQSAADSADFLLLIDSARQYGLLEGGPEVNVVRCVAILERAADQGVFPTPLDRRRAWVARWLLRQRRALGISQQTIADQVRLPQPIISLIERGRRDISAAEWERLNAALEQLRKEHGL